MRYAWLIVLPISLLPSGCSEFIASAGTDLEALKTKEEVHAKFGEPIATGTTEEGLYEDFRSRRKFRDPIGSQGCAMGFGMTMGLGEFYQFPLELFLVGRSTLLGQDVRFTYDAAGKVKHAYLNGGRISFEPPEPYQFDVLNRFPFLEEVAPVPQEPEGGH